MAKTYKIHPAIGIARVGDSEETYPGPERPGTFALPEDGNYRDASGRLRRQAPRFTVFEYDDATPGAEPRAVAVGEGGITRIDWSVHLANKKAVWFVFDGLTGEGPGGYPPTHPLRNPTVTDPAERARRFIIDPGRRSLAADGTPAVHQVDRGSSPDPAAETWPPPLTGGRSIDRLGTLSVDGQGRLSVAGGLGVSGTPGPLPAGGALHYANNNDWFDDTSDGPVNARVVFDDGTETEAEPAWVVAAPPDYAPAIENVVTLYDLLYDLGLREFGLDTAVFDPAAGGFQASFRPSFTRDVYPILKRALDYRWVNEEAGAHDSPAFDLDRLSAPPAAGETPSSNRRLRVFRRMRDPDNVAAGPARQMPLLHNDGTGGVPPETLRFTVTRYQYFVLKQWSEGAFESDWTGAPPAPPAEVTASGLDRAAADAATGGSFFPGMEVTWNIRDPRIFVSPFAFRIRHGASESDPNGLSPGDATKRMALPWQADFLKCADNWWPAQRPNQVIDAAGDLKEWARIGGNGSHVRLIEVWPQLGVVKPDPANPGEFREAERLLAES